MSVATTMSVSVSTLLEILHSAVTVMILGIVVLIVSTLLEILHI